MNASADQNSTFTKQDKHQKGQVPGIFITGTGTDVGKTVVSLALCALIDSIGKKPAYYKPIQCGCIDVGNNCAGGDEEWIKTMLPFSIKSATGIRFKNAVSPHLAAEKENKKVSLELLRQKFTKLESVSDLIVCEGAGGPAVPLDRCGTDMLDLAAVLKLPVLLVCLPGLGTLNHAILSHSYLKKYKFSASGFIMCHLDPEKPEIFTDNIQTIKQITELPYWGEISFLDGIAASNKLSQAEIAALTLGFTDDACNWIKKKN